MPDIRPVKVTGTPGGIYQGPNPPPNTVRDMCNIDTSRGLWGVRPGAYRFAALPYTNIVGAAEYKADARYGSHDFIEAATPVSIYDAMVVVSAYPGTTSYLTEVFSNRGRSSVQLPDSQENADAGVYSMAQMIRRNIDAAGNVTYAPVLVMSNGMDDMIYYYQRTSNKTAVNDLDSIEDTQAGLVEGAFATLHKPPKAAVLATWNQILFAANVPDGGNRIQWTGFDAAQIGICNFWPAENFTNIGFAGETITNMVPFKDVMLVFTDRKVYAMSGSGLDSGFRIDEVFSESGALPRCAVDVGDSVIFASHSGVYQTSGAKTRRISHPALSETWDRLKLGGEFGSALYDPERQQVYIGTRVSPYSDTTGPYSDMVLVYDLKHGAWSRWGSWTGAAGEDPDSYLSMRLGFVSTEFFRKPRLVFAGYTNLHLIDDFASYDQPGSSQEVLYWFIKTHLHFDGDENDKLMRHSVVEATKSGLWDLHVMVYTDEDDSLVHAIRRKCGDDWTFITDAVSSVTHAVGPQVNSFKLPADGPVDIYDTRTMRRLVDSQTLATTGVGYMKLSSAYVSSGMGRELVLPEDLAEISLTSMAARSMFTATSVSYSVRFAGDGVGNTAQATFESPRMESIVVGQNVVSKQFGLWMSGDSHRADIHGWGLWVRPLRTLRPR